MSVSLPCMAVAAFSTYICPSRISSLNSKSCPKMAGEIFNFLYFVHPRQMSLFSALKELLLSFGKNLGKWKPEVFLLAPALRTLCNMEVFCFLEYKGYEKILWLMHLGDQWPCRHGNCVIRASLVPDSMRWGSVSGVA